MSREHGQKEGKKDVRSVMTTAMEQSVCSLHAISSKNTHQTSCNTKYAPIISHSLCTLLFFHHSILLLNCEYMHKLYTTVHRRHVYKSTHFSFISTTVNYFPISFLFLFTIPMSVERCYVLCTPAYTPFVWQVVYDFGEENVGFNGCRY